MRRTFTRPTSYSRSTILDINIKFSQNGNTLNTLSGSSLKDKKKKKQREEKEELTFQPTKIQRIHAETHFTKIRSFNRAIDNPTLESMIQSRIMIRMKMTDPKTYVMCEFEFRFIYGYMFSRTVERIRERRKRKIQSSYAYYIMPFPNNKKEQSKMNDRKVKSHVRKKCRQARSNRGYRNASTRNVVVGT